MALMRKLRDTLFPQRLDARLDDELQFHFEQKVEDLVAQGVSPEEARREAAHLFGNRTHLRETTRDRDVLMWLESILHDLRFAVRSLQRSPGFAAVAILSLAFGIGVNAAIFTLVHAILLKELPVAEPHRLVEIRGRIGDFSTNAFSYPAFRELARQASIFESAIGFHSNQVLADPGDGAQRAMAQFVSGGYFRFFNARPVMGRLLNEEDDREVGAHPVCVLSYDAWQALLGGDPDVLQRRIRIRAVTLRIVGVVAPGFTGAELQARHDLYVPASEVNALTGIERDSANYIWLNAVGRLRRHMTRAEASARLAAASRAIEDALPKDHANADAVYELLDASKGFDSWRTDLHDPLLILMVTVALVLLVACANLANLLLARGAERRQEFAIRLAIGIGRGRLIRQLLVETALVAAVGGAFGLLLSGALIQSLLAMFNGGSEWKVLQISPDSTVLLFTFAVCLVTILVAGLYPAWQASRTGIGPGLQNTARAGRRGVMRRALILVQVTLAVVLAFGASLFAHSLRNLKTIDLGYKIERVLVVQIGVNEMPRGVGVNGVPHDGKPAASPMGEILDRARQLPGVEAAAIASPGPLSGMMVGIAVSRVEGGAAKRDLGTIHTMLVTPGYFTTMRARLIRGRDFSRADRAGAPPVAIVNQRFAALAWPGVDPIGKHFDGMSKGTEVIGISANSRDRDVHQETAPTVYLAYDQHDWPGGSVALRCAAPLGAIESGVRRIVKSAAPGYQVDRVASLELVRDNQLHLERLLAFLSSLFGALGVALALIGIYGLIAYSVKRRTREIGIRISIGAQRWSVLWLFAREAALLVAAGMLLGLPLALLLARFAGKLLYRVPTSDPIGIAATVALLGLGGLAASLLPARGATRVSPVEALRYD